jgi:uncharacterized protein (DUF302 family)
MKGLLTIESDYTVKETIDRLSAILKSKGITIFSRIDHAANAEKAGLPLRPTELIIFGNPEAGTILMQDNQTAGIDLPLKALAWQDESGKVWLTHNDMQWIAERHELTMKSITSAKVIEEGTTHMCNAAAKK